MSRRHGFRIIGHISGERRLVNARAAFSGYAACDPKADVKSEAYLSAFHFGDDFMDHLKAKASTAGFNGPCGSDYLWWDVDRDGQPEVALKDTRALVLHVVERYSLRDEELLIFLSGGKGYHIGVPTALWQPEPSPIFNLVCKVMAHTIAAEVPGGAVAIDAGIYDKVRAFRAPNSRHPKTGLHKRLVTADELMVLDASAIALLAKKPAPFEPSQPMRRCQKLEGAWLAAGAEVEQARLARQASAKPATGAANLNRLTLEFICDGAKEGERHRRLFSASANLAEFGCPRELAMELLLPAACDSGLAPKDAQRQIDCGLAQGGKNRG